jgi:hypothetical protein
MNWNTKSISLQQIRKDDIIDDLDEDDDDEELYLGNPVSGANELLRFLRIRQLLME